jgi:hypothetical protein
MSLDDLKAKLPGAIPPVENKEKAPEEPAAPVVEEKKFQHYHSSLTSMTMISKIGQRINFVGGKFITADPSVIRYLDDEIEMGMREITKGELLTEKEADPMEVFKAKVIAEYLEQQAREAVNAALGVKKDFGDSPTQKLNPSTSELVCAFGLVS